MKKVLGLDLGTTSIGWALVNQAENSSEKSSIIRAGVRVNPLTTDEKDGFTAGKDITTNADRRMKRSARRNLQRFKLRRDNLVSLMKEQGWIDDEVLLHESGPQSTFETYRLRAKAVTDRIGLDELARVFLMINRKRGYKSSRKTGSSKEESGRLIDGMEIARKMYDKGITPAQYVLEEVNNNNTAILRNIPDFYRSDLVGEFDRIWNAQSVYYPEILTDELRSMVNNKGKNQVARIFQERYGILTADNKGKDKKLQALKWRAEALSKCLDKEVLAYVVSDLSGAISASSGYLGDISDRSKLLFFNNMTVGQYLMAEIEKNPQFRVRNKVFYRQDYMDEFERIWEKQALYHPELTAELKHEFRDIIIFYQRRLKSQKGLISFCEFESHTVRKLIDGKEKEITVGCRVAPKSSLLFQEYKLWQDLNNIVVTFRDGESRKLSSDEKRTLAAELNIKAMMQGSEAVETLYGKNSGAVLNFRELEGNRTMSALYDKYLEIVSLSGHDNVALAKKSASTVAALADIFEALGFNKGVLYFNADLPKEEYERQPSFRLWHLLYSYEGDKSNTGNVSLIEKISELCSMPKEYASILAGLSFQNEYASLSHKAMRKILPYLKQGYVYSDACGMAGYRHSKESLTKEEIESRELVDRLSLLPKNSLRNPVVEKILNQMVNVVNAIGNEYGRPDEIHVELARELKQSKDQRKKTSDAIYSSKTENKKNEEVLRNEFGLKSVSRNDLIRYKLYQELSANGYKTLYSDQYISEEKLFSKEIDIEHIIPQASLFDDSLANKTLEFRSVNLEKGNMTAMDFVEKKYGHEGLERYVSKVEDLYSQGKISRGKRNHLLMKESEIPSDFINRDLKDSQYIARKAREILSSYARYVMTTTGSVTKRLREDWGLVNVMQELNMDKYEKVGLTHYEERLDGTQVKRIDDWTKRNDHRHHAMDAITIAFTRPSHIQLLNNLAARSRKEGVIYGIWLKETHREESGWVFNSPMPYDALRAEVKNVLESILVSHKAKNKVMTRNVNRTKKAGGYNETVELTPRGPLHKESVYGQLRQYDTEMVTVNSRMTVDVVNRVSRKEEREALLRRLEENGGDPKKAFSGKNALSKNPICMADGSVIGPKVQCTFFRISYKIRKAVDSNLTVDKVIDGHIRKLLKQRLAEYGGDQKKAFQNLDLVPVWHNENCRIPVRTVTISENYDLDALHSLDDAKCGTVIRSERPLDFVNLRNNHHVAIYQDSEGNYQEKLVSFFEAVQRVLGGFPAVDKTFNSSLGWKFVFSMKINEMFIFPDEQSGFRPEELDLKDPANYSLISPYMFRVQALSNKDYFFRHHLETTLGYEKALKDITWKRVKSLDKLRGVVKVRINHLGEIVAVGEE